MFQEVLFQGKYYKKLCNSILKRCLSHLIALIAKIFKYNVNTKQKPGRTDVKYTCNFKYIFKM